MKKFFVIGAMFGLAACAQQPESIAAIPANGNAFATFNCSQLAQAEVATNQNIENLSAAQRTAANSDALGVFLIGLPVSSMGGGDVAGQLGVARGELQAIQRQKAAKGCS